MIDCDVTWTESGAVRSARYRSESRTEPPKQVVVADDRMSADAAYRLFERGTAILWRGDYHNARFLLNAVARRLPQTSKAASSPAQAFDAYRQAQARRARVLGMLLLPFEADHRIPLRRAPDVREACTQAYGPGDSPYVASLRELSGVIGAYEWRRKGIPIAALGARIHPHYGVFAPVRSEYVELVAQAPLPSRALAFDVGTGTGVLAAVLARRGVKRVIATEIDERALACAHENIARLQMTRQVTVEHADLLPSGRAPLIVCNPPWIPALATSAMDRAIYDQNSHMLQSFLRELPAHLESPGEGWLLLSDLAERLELRTRSFLLSLIDAAGLEVVSKIDARPSHPRATDQDDPLHLARQGEITTLWRLKLRTV